MRFQNDDFTSGPALSDRSFSGLALRGDVRYAIDGNSVTLAADVIANDRDADNVSGSLSLELWALPTSYQGGDFRGTPLAGVMLGTLPGGYLWTGTSLNVPYSAPGAGSWRVVLMLREWDGSGYVTVDSREFDLSLDSPEVAATVGPETKPVEVAAPAAVPVESAQKASKKSAAPAKPATAASPAAVATRKPESINATPVERLVEVDGVTKTLAKSIVARRPFSSWDEVRKLKGIGPKLLAKLREKLTLS